MNCVQSLVFALFSVAICNPSYLHQSVLHKWHRFSSNWLMSLLEHNLRLLFNFMSHRDRCWPSCKYVAIIYAQRLDWVNVRHSILRLDCLWLLECNFIQLIGTARWNWLSGVSASCRQCSWQCTRVWFLLVRYNTQLFWTLGIVYSQLWVSVFYFLINLFLRQYLVFNQFAQLINVETFDPFIFKIELPSQVIKFLASDLR